MGASAFHRCVDSFSRWKGRPSAFISSAAKSRCVRLHGLHIHQEIAHFLLEDLSFNIAAEEDRVDGKHTRDPFLLADGGHLLTCVPLGQRLDIALETLVRMDEQCMDMNGPSYAELADELQGLCGDGELDKAMDVLLRMDQQGMVPCEIVYWSLLRACCKRNDLTQAKVVHAHMACHALEITTSLAEHLASTLAKCGGLEDALQVFHILPYRTIYAYTALISGYVDSGRCEDALNMYYLMRDEGVEPDKYIFASLLKACGTILDLEKGKALHAHAQQNGLDSDVIVGSTLVSMYGKCGRIVEAENVFNGMCERNVVSWTAMLSAYVEHGQAQKALQLYGQMQEEGVSPNGWTFVMAFQACCSLAETEDVLLGDGLFIKVMPLNVGQAIHKDVACMGFDADLFVGCALVHLYGKCRSIMEAEAVFVHLSQHNDMLWVAMLLAYVEKGHAQKALLLYRQMQEEGVRPNERIYVIILQACCMLAETEDHDESDGPSTKVRVLGIVQALHADAQRKGLNSYAFAGSTLVYLYGNCGSIMEAECMFKRLSQSEAVSWTALLSVFVDNGQAQKALQLFRQMQEEGVGPNEGTFVVTLQACCSLVEKEEVIMDGRSVRVISLEVGQALHEDARRKGLDSAASVGSTLVRMFGKCGSIVEAEIVFGRLSQHIVVSWNAMLSAYVEQGLGEKALQLYRKMQEEGVTPDGTTFVCVLQACCETGSVNICRHIHFTIVSLCYCLSSRLATALVHAYGSCASMVDADAVVNALAQPNLIPCSALIAGYAREGNYAATLQHFEKMELAGIKSNAVTFLSLLFACSHAGLVDKGIVYFESMNRNHGLTPKMEHYFRMMDILGRAGDLRRMQDILTRMPVKPDLAMWLSLLGSCQRHGNVELGKQAFDEALQLQPKKTAAYILMSNLYADVGLWGEKNEE